MKKRFVIIGAGLTGLSVAYLLNKKYGNAIQITILERSSTPGGLVTSKQSKGFNFDLGPKGFLTSGEGFFTKQLIQDLSIPLLFCNKSAKKRYIRFNNKTRKIGLPSLLSQGLISSIIKDLRVKPCSVEETVRSFFDRHATPKMIQNILAPVTTGIRAGYPEVLSATLAFPSLKQREQQHGSLLKSFLHDFFSSPRKQAKTKSPMLATPKGGMSSLIKGLLKKLPFSPVYNEAVQKIILSPQLQILTHKALYPADTLIYTGHIKSLATLLPSIPFDGLLNKIKDRPLSCLSLGWDSPNILKKRGYGMLIADEPPILGIVWTTEIFPEIAQGKTQIALLFDSNLKESDALKHGILASQKYLNIFQRPDAFAYSFAPDGIPQLTPGFSEELSSLEQTLPHSIKLAGHHVVGPGVNRCIANAYSLVQTL
ncbi:protoporphyrinogen oxidase [Chlamydiifrater phoenicopteri]|uniref:protoporphyrinogen oxidase n=1 Tax=Chlamydiifrater phoenicopteri TaxID=2681469 RepID=UPI001BCAEA75|nr:protoporphyrinogen oxidase [Chlamydiifrater phoenicopteri]